MNLVFNRNYLIFIVCFLLISRVFSQNNDSLNYVFLNAVFENNLSKADSAIKNNANINFSTDEGATALHYAVMNNNPVLLLYLINRGADTEAADYLGYTPLILACNYGYDSLVYSLIMADASLEVTDKNKRTPLHHAVISGNPIVVEMLLFYGINPNIADITGKYPLNLSVQNRDTEITDILLQNGAIPDVLNSAGEHILFDAIRNNSTEIVELLLFYGCNTHQNSSGGYNYYELAFLYCDSRMVDILLQYRVKNIQLENLSDSIRKRPVWKYALLNDDEFTIDLLKEYQISRPYLPIMGNIYVKFFIINSLNDLFWCTGIEFDEVNYRLQGGFDAGMRFWPAKTYIEHSPDTLYLLSENRSFLSFYAGKVIPIVRFQEKHTRLDFVAGCRFSFTRARYRAMNMKESIHFDSFVPYLGFEYRKKGFKWHLTYQYWPYGSDPFSPHQIQTGFHFRIKSYKP